MSYSIAIWKLRSGREEFRVLRGTKIVSRHSTEREAMAALERYFKAAVDGKGSGQ